MTDSKTKKTKEKSRPRALALKTLFTNKGKIAKGEFFDCTEKEYAAFKKLKAV